MSNHLTLWIPGLRPNKQFVSELSKLPKNELPDLTNLNLILSRGEKVNARNVFQHDYLLHKLSEASLADKQWPLAEWRLALEDLEQTKSDIKWMCADPVYIHPDRAEALLFAYEELEIKPEEAKQLADLINQHYRDDPWELCIGDTHRWYIKCEQEYDINTEELHKVKGKNIFNYLPSGKDASYWQQCINELQMLLHSSEVNQRREEKGLLPINSLWIWGYSNTSDTTCLPWQTIHTDNAILSGLGVLSNIQVYPVSDSFEDMQDIKGDVLVVNNTLQVSLQQQDLFLWLDELRYLEKYWFEPIIKKLKSTRDLQVTLLIDDDEAYQFSNKQLKRWWRFSNKNKIF